MVLTKRSAASGDENVNIEAVQTRTHCCRNIVAHDVSLRAQTGKHLLRTRKVSEQTQKHFCVPDTKFVSATNVARAGKRGNICVGNNVSATMCPRLPVPLGSLSTRVFETRTATGSELFSLLTCPHTTTFTLLSIFSPLETSNIQICSLLQFCIVRVRI